MLLAYLLLFCFSFDKNIILGRRKNKIAFKDNFNINQRSIDDSWYYVQFNFDTSPLEKGKMISNLQKQGIYLKSTNYISKGLFNLYLSANQLNYILTNHLGKAQEVKSDNKLVNSPLKNWSILTVESSNSRTVINDLNNQQINNKCAFLYQPFTQSTFTVKSSKECLLTLIPTLTENKRIFAVSFSNEDEELNCRISGYVQKNSDKPIISLDDSDGSHIVEIDRFLNKQGLDGTGVTVLVDDTYLDTNSTFFYDPKHPNVEFNTILKDHRKLVYLDVANPGLTSDNEHGTHTAGTVSGRALDDSSSSSKYNGGAPGSKLAFYASQERGFIADYINKTVGIVKPQVSSNSWGTDYYGTTHDTMWDEVALHNKDQTLFVFAAGNSGQNSFHNGFQSLRSPGTSKNMLTVGALESVTVDESGIGTANREVYLTDDSSGDNYRTKLLDWSVADIKSNVGLKNLFDLGVMQVLLTRNTMTKWGNTTVYIIDSQEKFNQIKKDDPPYYVISTVEFTVSNFKDLGFKHTFPVMYLKNSSLPEYSRNHLYTNYRTTKGLKRADFSSKGTGNLGIMKPDVMCPGTSVVSTKSVVNGTYNHKELTIKLGTSMATPACAGAAAIVYQYFQDGRYRKKPMKISSALARSFIITCSDPISSVYPNAEEGFGSVNLGKFIGNGDDVDNKRLLVGEHLKITIDDSNHLMTTFSVNGNDKALDLRVTLSYVDAVLSPDSMAALAVDLDLVVVSPSGAVYRGNQRADNTEEHYSTNERVIIPSNEIERGNYEVHVFSSYPTDLQNLADIVDFAITIFGPLNNDQNGDFVEFKKATKCIPLADDFSGECNKLTTYNDCSFLFYGRSCQIEAFEFYPDIPREIIKVPPYGLTYVALEYPIFAFTYVTYKITPVSLFDPKVSVFFKKVVTAGSEIEADLITSSKDFTSTYYEESGEMPESDIYALAMIYNTSPYQTEFVISAEYEEYERPMKPPPSATPTKEKYDFKDNDDWKNEFLVAASLAIAFGAIMVGFILALVVVLVKKKRKNVNPAITNALNDSIL